MLCSVVEHGMGWCGWLPKVAFTCLFVVHAFFELSFSAVSKDKLASQIIIRIFHNFGGFTTWNLFCTPNHFVYIIRLLFLFHLLRKMPLKRPHPVWIIWYRTPLGSRIAPEGLTTGFSFLIQVILWDLRQCKILRRLIGHYHDVVTCDFSPDGALLATASYDARVLLWDPHTGVNLKAYQ